MAPNRPREGERRERTKFSKDQLQILIEAFEKDPYPDITVREELAKQLQIPQSRIHVWFQNRRGRKSKDPQKKLHPKADAAAPRSRQGALPAPHHHDLQGLSPAGGSSFGTLQSLADQFSSEVERASEPEADSASGPAGFGGHAGVLDANVALPDLEIPAEALGEPSGSSYHSSAMGAFPAPQQPFQVGAGGTDTDLGEPRELIYGNWALQGQGQHFPFDWQSCGGWVPLFAPQQPLSQHLEAQKQPPPAPSAQEHWLDLDDIRYLMEEEEP